MARCRAPGALQVIALQELIDESFAYILILTLAIATRSFAIAFRDPQDLQVVVQTPPLGGVFLCFPREITAALFTYGRKPYD